MRLLKIKQALQVGKLPSMDIFNLPCVISLEKALADKSTFFYIILSVNHKRVAVPGDWVCEDENGTWVVLSDSEYKRYIQGYGNSQEMPQSGDQG